MMRGTGVGTFVVVVGAMAATGCAQDAPRGQAFDPTMPGASVGTGGSTGGGMGPGGDTTGGMDDDDGVGSLDETGDPTSPDPTSDPSGGESSGGEEVEPADCTPAWATPWVGSPCGGDGDCGFDGGFCLLPTDGFPCGTCSLDCSTTCPDTEGAPVTYCINGTDVGLPDAGHCLSKCDGAVVPGGCRDGYVCNTLERFDESGVSGVCIPAEFDANPGGELIDEIDHEFLISHLGGDPVSAFGFGPDVDSFQMYLDAVGVQHTTASEIVEPYNPSAAMGCGYTILLPERDQWEKIGALAMFIDELTDLVGEPIFVRNWWRPPCYNAAVGGAAGGDHPDADAVDIDFSSNSSRALAQQFLCETYWLQDIVSPEEIAPGADVDPRLNMSVGLGGVSIHLGVLSNGGRRDWKYSSYTVEPNSGSCW